MNAILLAAGYGTRIRSLFPDTPKALIEVGGRALIDHLLANLARSGVVESALVVTNDRYHAALQRHLSAATPPLPTSVISDGTASEQERLGALGDLHLALRRLDRGGDVLVAATDKLLAFELAGPLRFARERAAPVTFCVRIQRSDDAAILRGTSCCRVPGVRAPSGAASHLSGQRGVPHGLGSVSRKPVGNAEGGPCRPAQHTDHQAAAVMAGSGTVAACSSPRAKLTDRAVSSTLGP